MSYFRGLSQSVTTTQPSLPPPTPLGTKRTAPPERSLYLVPPPQKRGRRWAFEQRPERYDPDKYKRTVKTPLIRLQSEWDPDTIGAAKLSHKRGKFETSGLLWLWMQETSRLKSVLTKRVNALGVIPFRVEPASPEKQASPIEKAVAHIIKERWDELFPPELRRGVVRSCIGMGVALCRITWCDDGVYWWPKLTKWTDDAFYFSDVDQRWYARTREGMDVKVTPGQGWCLFLPEGPLGFQTGSVLSLSIPCLRVSMSETDWANYDAANAAVIRLANVPRGAVTTEKDAYLDNVESLGRDTFTLLCPKNQDGSGFSMEQLDTQTGNIDTFERSQESAETKITIEILGQEKTTDDKGVGTYDAVEALQGVEDDLVLGDGLWYATTLRAQVLRKLCYCNYGNAELAPRPIFGEEKGIDAKARADGDKATAEAATALDAAMAGIGKKLDKVAYFEEAGVKMLDTLPPPPPSPGVPGEYPA